MINPEEIKVKNNSAKFVYLVDGSDKAFTQIHTVVDIDDDPVKPKALKSFVDEYVAQDFADEHYFKTKHDCIIVSSVLNVTLNEANY